MRLSSEQIQKIADISGDLGVVAVASVVLPALLDRFNVWAFIVGLMVASLCFVFSLIMIKAK